MKGKYRLFRRGNGIYYAEDRESGRQESLKTKDEGKARRLLDAKNQAFENPALSLAMGKTYMAAHDPKLVTRTWGDAMAVWAKVGQPSSLERKAWSVKSKPFDLIRGKVITLTTADDLLAVMRVGGSSTNKFLRTLHNLAMGHGWLAWPIIPQKAWPAFVTKVKRAISREEHAGLLAVEGMPEWRDYYQFLWEVGCSQTDGATITAAHIDWTDKTLAYHRHKLAANSEPAVMSIGPRLEAMLRRRPAAGYLFPKIAAMPAKSRSIHFKKRTDKAKIKGVTLHSYRYAWAERGATAGYPERWAKAALGHKSAAVHQGYAKKAKVVCPSLEEYESKVVPLRQTA